MKLDVEQVLTLLREGPERIAQATAKASLKQLQSTPGRDEWSANDVLAHLRTCADVWGGYIDRILNENHPTIRAMSPRRWIHSTDYMQQQFRKSLRTFAAQRSQLLEVLNSLSSKQWSRGATITGAGKALEKTVFDYAEWLATHERPHVKQIRSTVETLG